MPHRTLHRYLPAIQRLPIDRTLKKEDLLTEDFLLAKDQDLSMYYAPHNEYINNMAKIVIVGITPGWSQMKTAFDQLTKCLASDADTETCLMQTKEAARFAGSMRANLLMMLDQCDIPQVLDIPDSAYLFDQESHSSLHTTSIIKYPVFFKENNYTGHRPSIDQSPLLKQFAYEKFPNELEKISPPALVIPLGKTVEQVILKLKDRNKLSNHHYVTGFPHPSGANGHRVKQFEQQKENLIEQVRQWGEELGQKQTKPINGPFVFSQKNR